MGRKSWEFQPGKIRQIKLLAQSFECQPPTGTVRLYYVTAENQLLHQDLQLQDFNKVQLVVENLSG
jgi:hypothetical protein